jgi:hypothetical protein
MRHFFQYDCVHSDADPEDYGMQRQPPTTTVIYRFLVARNSDATRLVLTDTEVSGYQRLVESISSNRRVVHNPNCSLAVEINVKYVY